MTRVHNPAYQCGGKIQYQSRARARQIQRRIQSQGGMSAGGRKLHAYLCPHCGWWHLGHDKADIQQRALAAEVERRREANGFYA